MLLSLFSLGFSRNTYNTYSTSNSLISDFKNINQDAENYECMSLLLRIYIN